MRRKAPLLFVMALQLICRPLLADSTTTANTINFGPFNTSNWESSDFAGTAYRQWDTGADAFTFTWTTTAGDQIGQIGLTYGSSYLATNWVGVQIDSIDPNCLMSTKATYTPANSNWFYWSIYGWTHSSYTYWGNTPNGWDNEFYIILYTDKTVAAFLQDPGCVSIGSVTVDGVTYDCYNTLRSSQSQWLAVSRAKTFGASVHIEKIFEYWRSKGLANEYVVSLGWALEGFNGSAGTLQLTNSVIPNLTLNTVPPALAATDTPTMPQWMLIVLGALLICLGVRRGMGMRVRA